MATKPKKRTVPLKDTLCENDLIFDVELRRNKKSKCGNYRQVKDMTAAVRYMKDLIKEYPDLEDEIRSIGPSAWVKIYRIRDQVVKAKVLQIVLEFLRSGNCPVPLYERGEKYTLCIEDILEIIRYARGKPPSRLYRRSLCIRPDDVVLLKRIVKIAITDFRRAGDNSDIDKVTKLQNKILGPKGMYFLEDTIID